MLRQPAVARYRVSRAAREIILPAISRLINFAIIHYYFIETAPRLHLGGNAEIRSARMKAAQTQVDNYKLIDTSETIRILVTKPRRSISVPLPDRLVHICLRVHVAHVAARIVDYVEYPSEYCPKHLRKLSGRVDK